jgi:hypothetical protein
MTDNMSPADQLGFCTVRIACTNDGVQESVGTGFFLAFPVEGRTTIPVIITNRHVIKGATIGTFQLTEIDENGSPRIGTFTNISVEKFENMWLSHPDEQVDLCMMPMASLLRAANDQGKRFFYKSVGKDLIATSETMSELSSLEEVVMVGYPVGIWDRANNMPIFRRGITASRPDLDYCGRKEFMIDVACFPGSSGSPVMLFNIGGYVTKDGKSMLGGTRIKLLGVLYAAPQYAVDGHLEIVPVPTTAIAISRSHVPVNLGLVIKAERLLEFEQFFPELQKS